MFKKFKTSVAKRSSNKLQVILAVATAVECILIALRGITPDLGLIILVGALTLPGVLAVMLLRLGKLDLHERILYSAALSLLSIMLAGLSANMILPLAGVQHPLSLPTFGPWYGAALILLMFAEVFRNRKIKYSLALPKVSSQSLGLGAALALLPALSVLGAASLNHGGGASFTMTMFLAIAAFASGLVIMQKRVAAWIWPWAIFTMGLAILWSNSLRGAFMTGHDIQLEYYVFRITDAAQHWSMANFRDAYNACLSITILPTVLKSLTGFGAFDQFKVIYQIIFAIFATGVYAISRRYVSPATAFIAAFIFITFPTFIIDMPMLVRQEMAFGFYIVLLLLLFNRSLGLWPRRILFSLFSIGLVLSHYSTTFVTVGVLAGAYALMTPWAFNAWRGEKSKLPRPHRALSIGVLVAVLSVAVVWTGVYTKTSNNIGDQFGRISRNVPALLTGSRSSETLKYAPVHSAKASEQTLLNQYTAEQHTAAISRVGESNLYANAVKYPVTAVKEPELPVTRLGSWATNHHLAAGSINAAGKKGYALAIQGLIALALAVTFIYRKKLRIEPEFIVLAPVGVAILAAQAVLPMIEYGLFRMLQQDLVFLALPVTLAALQILSWMRIRSKQVRTSIVAVGFSFAFLFISGFIPQLLGGSVGQLALNNSGFYYDAYYTSRADAAMFDWLKSNYQSGYPIHSDAFLRMKILANTSITTIDGITPGSLDQKSFVVLANENVTANRVSLYTKNQGDLLFYNYPLGFLSDHKNLVYSSNATKVYR